MASAGISTEPKKRLPAINIRMIAVRMRLYFVPLLFIVYLFCTTEYTEFHGVLGSPLWRGGVLEYIHLICLIIYVGAFLHTPAPLKRGEYRFKTVP